MILRPEKNHTQEILKTYRDAWNNLSVTSKRDTSRLLNLRCSQLPFCQNEFFVNTAVNPRYQSLNMSGLYYTSVGTVVHEVMQRSLPQYSNRIVGNWVCLECGSVEKFKSQQQCCGFPMQYEEISVDYSGIQGHVDCLFRVSKSSYYVVDFKTCSLSNSQQKEKDPGDAYKEQLRSYAVLLTKQYGLQIDGVMNLFLPRDNPSVPVAWSESVDKNTLRSMAKKLKHYKMAHKAALNVNSVKEAASLFTEFGRCVNKYCTVCSHSSPKAVLRDAARRAQTLPLIEAINESLPPEISSQKP